MANVRLNAIYKSFGEVRVIHGISLDIASGEFIGLLGASGCGKTTLLRIVAGLESVTSGTVEIDGRDVTGLPPEQRDIAMMFQSYALLPHLHKRLGLTTLFVTHDQEEALSLSHRVILLNGGHIEQQGSPAAMYARPDTGYASSFLGAFNLVPATLEPIQGKIVAVLSDGQRLALADHEKSSGPASRTRRLGARDTP